MRSTKKQARRFVMCIQIEEYAASLEARKLYEMIPDSKAESQQQLRVIDESGEDYLYPKKYFIPIDLPSDIEQTVINAA